MGYDDTRHSQDAGGETEREGSVSYPQRGEGLLLKAHP